MGVLKPGIAIVITVSTVVKPQLWQHALRGLSSRLLLSRGADRFKTKKWSEVAKKRRETAPYRQYFKLMYLRRRYLLMRRILSERR